MNHAAYEGVKRRPFSQRESCLSVRSSDEATKHLAESAEGTGKIDLKERPTLRSTDVIEALAELFLTKELPEHIRSDNGPESCAKAVRE